MYVFAHEVFCRGWGWGTKHYERELKDKDKDVLSVVPQKKQTRKIFVRLYKIHLYKIHQCHTVPSKVMHNSDARRCSLLSHY
jgi:hypothetical protein